MGEEKIQRRSPVEEPREGEKEKKREAHKETGMIPLKSPGLKKRQLLPNNAVEEEEEEVEEGMREKREREAPSRIPSRIPRTLINEIQ